MGKKAIVDGLDMTCQARHPHTVECDKCGARVSPRQRLKNDSLRDGARKEFGWTYSAFTGLDLCKECSQ